MNILIRVIMAVSAFFFIAETRTADAASVTVYGSIKDNYGYPLCALVLANGQHMFSCDPDGEYSLTVPLDSNGRITIFAFADGHLPVKVDTSTPGQHDFVVKNQWSSAGLDFRRSTVKLTDECYNGLDPRYKFFDLDHRLTWPAPNSSYILPGYGQTSTNDLYCYGGSNICFGAQAGRHRWSYGLDGIPTVNGDNGCFTCGDDFTTRLTCF